IMTRLLLRPGASQDIDEHFLTVAADSPPVAVKLLEAIEAALERIRQNPEIGSPHYAKSARLWGLRMWPVPDYLNDLIFYPLWKMQWMSSEFFMEPVTLRRIGPQGIATSEVSLLIRLHDLPLHRNALHMTPLLSERPDPESARGHGLARN